MKHISKRAPDVWDHFHRCLPLHYHLALTHWPQGIWMTLQICNFQGTFNDWGLRWLFVMLPSGDHHWAALMISQRWFSNNLILRWPDLCRHISSFVQNGLNVPYGFCNLLKTHMQSTGTLTITRWDILAYVFLWLYDIIWNGRRNISWFCSI